jgi:hypothetical protein
MTRHVVAVNEVMVFATGRGVDWWITFQLAVRTTSRITEVTVTPAGALCHGACDSRDHATSLAATMIEHRLPSRALRARRLRERGAAR